MLIKREVLEAIKAGQITLQFRRWTRPSVKAGGTLKTRVGLLRIGRIDDSRRRFHLDAHVEHERALQAVRNRGARTRHGAR